MTREEEIQEKAKSQYYHFCVRETCEDEENECTNCPYGKVIEPLVTMAKWADQHPRKGLWDAEKVIEWLDKYADSYTYFSPDKQETGFIGQMFDDLRKAMEE